MSINSKCYLPNDVRAEDIVNAIAFLCGAKRERQNLDGGGVATWHVNSEVSTRANERHIDGLKVYVLPTHDIQYYTIHIASTNCDEEWHEGNLFLYPSENYPNRILLYAGVSEFWKQVERALIDMFGGELDDNDCDLSELDYSKRKPRKVNCPNDGEAWQKFQDDMYNLPVLFHFVEE